MFKQHKSISGWVLLMAAVMAFSCAKKNGGPAGMQEIRGTQWISDLDSLSGAGTATYIHLEFLSGGSDKTGTGVYKLYDRNYNTITFTTPFTWSLSGTVITLSYINQFSLPVTKTGSWDAGKLYIGGSYEKQ